MLHLSPIAAHVAHITAGVLGAFMVTDAARHQKVARERISGSNDGPVNRLHLASEEWSFVFRGHGLHHAGDHEQVGDAMLERVSRRAVLRTVGGAATLRMSVFLAPVPAVAAADDFPNRPIKLIVPSAAGGPTDLYARTLAEAMATELGQPVVVENRTGGGGVTAYTATARSAANGYTLVIVDSAVAILPSLHANLPYDLNKDLAPVSLVVRGTTILAARKSLEASTAAELVAWAKRNPGKLTYGSAGIGSVPHLNAELFKLENDITGVHVPYQGGASGLTDLAAGRIDIFFISAGTVKPFIDNGSIKGLAAGGRQRTPILPNVPTYYEGHLPSPKFDLGTWWGVMGPANMPPEVVGKLNDAIGKAMKSPQLIKRFTDMGSETLPSNAAEFAGLIKAEREKWADVIKRANVQPN